MSIVRPIVVLRQLRFLLGLVSVWNHNTLANAALIAERATVPAAISVLPSQEWDGNDGPWSSFTLQVGTPPQNVKVFVSTEATQSWVVATEGCGSGDVSDCPKLRGGVYNNSASGTYVPNLSNPSTSNYQLGLESKLGYTSSGRYGFDDITVGIQGGGGPSLKNQTIAELGNKDFFLGIFGLVPRPSNFSDENHPVPSFIENLRNESKIPSSTWGYTAGNQYRNNEVLGSLTLGGYDSSRFIPNNVTFDFSLVDDSDLAVQLTGITAATNTALLPSPIKAFLDSTIPYIFLPQSACALFESTFNLIYNETSQLYFLSDTQHTLLKAQNPTITFTLQRPDGTSKPVNISLPYSAFDLTAEWPLVDNGSRRYFPLKRANESTQYKLGRTFFQEAYVIADYDRKNFSVSQCKWDSISSPNIISIFPPGFSTKSSSGVPIGAIAGAAAGGVVLIALILFYLFWYKPRHRKQKASELAATEIAAQAHQPLQPTEYQKPELDSHEIGHPPAIQVYETDGTKAQPAVEIGSSDVRYELPSPEPTPVTGESEEGYLDARDRGRRSVFSWRGRRRDGSISNETELSSGWGSTRSTFSSTAPTQLGRGSPSSNYVEPEPGTETISTLSSGFGSPSPRTFTVHMAGSGSERGGGSERGRGRGSFNSAEGSGTGTGEGTLSSVSSRWGPTNSPRSVGSEIVSPSTPVHMKREIRR